MLDLPDQLEYKAMSDQLDRKGIMDPLDRKVFKAIMDQQAHKVCKVFKGNKVLLDPLDPLATLVMLGRQERKGYKEM